MDVTPALLLLISFYDNTDMTVVRISEVGTTQGPLNTGFSNVVWYKISDN
jgi:hypothetical protein